MNPRAIGNNVLIKIQMSNKEKYGLTEDIQIEIQRGYEFNRRLDYPSFGIIINAKNIPSGAYCLVHHNSTEATYEVPNGNIMLTESEIADGYKVFSIDKDMCFCYSFDNKNWLPCDDYLLTLRIFEEYKGVIHGVGNQQLMRRLYVVSGVDTYDGEETDLRGKVCVVTDNSDYEIIWHNDKMKQQSIIRTRHRELLGIDEGMTDLVNKDKLLIGINADTAKPKSKIDGNQTNEYRQD